jgi:hypothetical protein
LGWTIGSAVLFGVAGAALLIAFTEWPTTVGNPYNDWGPVLSMVIVAGGSAIVGGAIGWSGARALGGLVAGAIGGAIAGGFVGGLGPGGSEAESALSLVWGLVLGGLVGATLGLTIGIWSAARHRRRAETPG